MRPCLWLSILLAGCGASDGDARLGLASQPLIVPADCPAGYNVIVAAAGQLVINGTNGSDCIIGNALPNVIRGRRGADFIAGGLGADLIRGHDGADEIFGEDGADDLRGNNGVDEIDGGPGDDFIRGGNRGDTLIGGPGDDTIRGNNGRDVIEGGEGNDNIRGGNGADFIHGGPGDDQLWGNSGTDTMVGGGGDDTLNDGPGREGFLSIDAELNGAPHIDSLSVAPSKFITVCESTTLTVTAFDPEDDPVAFSWTVATMPSAATLSLSASNGSAVFSADMSGAYELTVTATDGHGAASSSLLIPIYISDCI